MDLEKRVGVVESKLRAQYMKAFESWPTDELEFFSIHGWLPTDGQRVENSTRSFVCRGMRTTIILEDLRTKGEARGL